MNLLSFIAMAVLFIWLFLLSGGYIPGISENRSYWITLLQVIGVPFIAVMVLGVSILRSRLNTREEEFDDDLDATDKPQKSSENEEYATEKYRFVDNLLDRLNDDERAYLERKLGAGELVLSDDGELITLEEYRKRKTE